MDSFRHSAQSLFAAGMELALGIRRFILIVIYTLSMYLVTHIIVFTLLPLGLIIIAFKPETAAQLKQSFVKLLFMIVGKRVRVTGLENVEAGKEYIIISNYPSFYAGFALIKVFPEASVVAHAFTSKIPLLGYFLKRIGTIFVDPKKGKSTKHAIDMGLNGEGDIKSIIIFPEGKRTSDGQIDKFMRGFSYMLRQSSLDLLPVTLNGFYQLKPMKRFYLDPDAEPKVIIHRPLRNSEVQDMTHAELLEKTLNVIKNDYQP